jgi:hypothetical protein
MFLSKDWTKSCRGFEGVIIEVIQMIGFKNYKVEWSNGQVLIHLSRSLAVWGLQAAEGAINLFRFFFMLKRFSDLTATQNCSLHLLFFEKVLFP